MSSLNTLTRKNKILINLCFWVLLINFLIENFIYLFPTRELIITFQVIINILYLIYSIATVRNFKLPKISGFVIFIAFFLLTASLFSSSIIQSYNKALKFVLPLFFLIIGYNLLKNRKSLIYFINKLWIIQIIFIVGIIYANVFNVGETFYEQGIKVGFISINSLYTVTFSWIILLFFLKDLKISTIVSVTILATTFIITILILKRTVILLMVLSLFFYLIQNLQLKRIVSLSVIFFLGLIVFQMYFSSYFEESLEARSDRFSEDYSIEQEGRYRENVLPFMHMKDNPLMYFVGTGEVFNDRPYHIRYLNADRELHNSFVRIFWNGGLILFIVFLTFYYKQFRYINKARKRVKNNSEINSVAYFATLFIALRFLSELSSGITYISYNTLSYFVIGGIIILCKNAISSKRKSRSSKTKQTQTSLIIGNKVVK